MTAKIHSEIAEVAGISPFSHWLLFPETDEHYAFVKEVTLDRHTCRDRLKEKGIQIFGICSRPQGYPTKPEYKISNQ